MVHQFFSLFLLGLVQSSHNFLRHLAEICGENRLEAAHKSLEERVVEDFLTQVEKIFEEVLRAIDIGSRVQLRSLPLSFVLQGQDLQDDLDFRSIQAL